MINSSSPSPSLPPPSLSNVHVHSQSDGRGDCVHDVETSLSLIPGQARFADVAVQLRKGRGREGEGESGIVDNILLLHPSLPPSLSPFLYFPPSLPHICKAVEGAHDEDALARKSVKSSFSSGTLV